MKDILLVVLVISVLGACSLNGFKEEPAKILTLEQVETALTEQGLKLDKADLPSDNAFIQELYGVSPKVYLIDGNTLSIYVFPSVKAREKGLDDFENKNATAELVSHKTFTHRNILVFYEQGNKDTNKAINSAINELE